MAAPTIMAGYHKLYYTQYAASPTPALADYIGTTGDEGIRLTRDVMIQEITSDELGPEAIVDGVYQGSNLILEFVVQEVDTEQVQAMLNPFLTPTGETANQSEAGVSGQLASGVMGTLTAIPVTNSPAAVFESGDTSGGTGIRRFMGIAISPVMETLDTTPRFVPVRFRCYPFDNGSGTLVYWTWEATI